MKKVFDPVSRAVVAVPGRVPRAGSTERAAWDALVALGGARGGWIAVDLIVDQLKAWAENAGKAFRPALARNAVETLLKDGTLRGGIGAVRFAQQGDKHE